MLVNNVWGPHFYSVGPTFWIGSIHDETPAMKIHAIKIHARTYTFYKFMPWPGGANVRPMPIATWTVDMETVRNHHNDSIQTMLTKKDPVLTATASVASIL